MPGVPFDHEQMAVISKMTKCFRETLRGLDRVAETRVGITARTMFLQPNIDVSQYTRDELLAQFKKNCTTERKPLRIFALNLTKSKQGMGRTFIHARNHASTPKIWVPLPWETVHTSIQLAQGPHSDKHGASGGWIDGSVFSRRETPSAVVTRA